MSFLICVNDLTDLKRRAGRRHDLLGHDLLCWIFCAAFGLCLSGCTTPVRPPQGVVLHTCYREIDNPEVSDFVASGLKILQRDYAPLEFPVNQVLLRYSLKNPEAAAYDLKEGFSLTECVDTAGGVFAIYIAVPVSDPEFYPLLAHEIGHLKQPSVKDDWEMEGFCMVFSEKLCVELGKDWSVWTKRFQQNVKDPYAKAYWKQRELSE